jgi:hypothetical protein
VNNGSAKPKTFEDRVDTAIRLLDSEGERGMGLKLLTMELKNNGRNFGWLADKVKDDIDLEQALIRANMHKEQLITLLNAEGKLYTEQQMREYGEYVAETERARAGATQAIIGEQGRGGVSLNGISVSWQDAAIFLLNKIGVVNAKHHEFIQKCAGSAAAGFSITPRMERYLVSLYFQHGGRP